MSRSRRIGSWLAMLIALFVLAATAPPVAGAAYPVSPRQGGPLVKAPEEAVSDDDYLCAWLALASYDDRIGQLARSELAAYGYNSEAFREDSDVASARYFFWTHDAPGQPPRYLLSVMGTTSLKDIRSDLSLRKVPFAGATPAEFADNYARMDNKSAAEPLAHNGFVRYVQTGFFSEPTGTGKTFGEDLRDKLLADSRSRLTLTGHSLGGAAAVLLAGRLLDMGVPGEQINVVTFGAPAVANQAFVDHFGAMRVDRVILAGDPVKSSLQSFSSAYKQFGRKVVLSAHKGMEPFSHEMVGYVDAALRSYYADRIGAGAAPPVATADEPPHVYLAIAVDFDQAIAADGPYLKLVATDLLARQIPGLVVGTVPGTAAPDAIGRAARDAHCQYALVQRYESERQRNKDAIFTYLIRLQETVVDTRGQVVTMQELTTSTDRMPPILAGLYNCAAGQTQGAGLGEQGLGGSGLPFQR